MSRRNYNRNISIKGFIKAALVVIAAVILAVLIREGIYLITDTGFYSDDKHQVKGLDVSNHQGEIDWEGIDSQGFQFAYIKATEGSGYVDPRFEYNWKNARKHIFRVGAYHFMSYDTPGETQADTFIKTVPLKRDALPPVIDVEFYGDYRKSGHHPTMDQMYSVLDVMLAKLEKRYGKKPVIYTNRYIYKTYISGRYDDYDIWISDQNIPDTLSDGSDWTFCQYTFNGTSKYISGGSKHFDADVFNGSRYKLRHY
ncbi:MAG: GH25 family lysozyme [Lentihominibacter sp.]|nr:GH25 family lysozyme [Bacillota bacterium]MDY4959458.1 GH25 family lysozyme [Lentihominibacter sp.]